MKQRRRLPSKRIPNDWGKYFTENKDKTTNEIMEDLQCARSTVTRHQREFGLNQPPGRRKGDSYRIGVKRITIGIDNELYIFLQQVTNIIYKEHPKPIHVQAILNVLLYGIITSHIEGAPRNVVTTLLNTVNAHILKNYGIDTQDKLEQINRIITMYCSEFGDNNQQ